ncbi:MAG: DUF2461 domain-containing protein [Bacteroidota bacterium]
MAYFSEDFNQFFSDLRKNNDREWFNAHKKRYEKVVKEPFKAFIAALIEQARVIDPNILITPKDAIFRIYRDTRFSKDKTPYKLHASAVVSSGGRKDTTTPGIYIQISDEAYGLYSGIYQANSKQLYRIREHIAANLNEFEQLLRDPDFVEKFGGEIHGDKNKRIPKEFMPVAEQQPLMYNKAFYFFNELPPTTILKENLDEITIQHFQAARPLSVFFQEALA